MNPIEQHLIPVSAAERSIEVLNRFGIDIWLFTNDTWFIRNGDGEYVPLEKRAIRADPTILTDFTPHVGRACKIVGASSDFDLLVRCEAAMQEALGAQATAVRSQRYYLDITPPGCDKGTFVRAMAGRLGIPTAAVATIGDMENDLPMFAASGLSIAMGNAHDEIKARATRVTTSNEDDGFAGAVDMILQHNAAGHVKRS
jgi:Cof subfamily protein (haloacid dehalogenase superfamily)